MGKRSAVVLCRFFLERGIVRKNYINGANKRCVKQSVRLVDLTDTGA